MPKITSDHRTARRQLILDAARRCFLRDGVQATSMQDIMTEADLSAGGIYVYFKSKEEIIEAIALDTIGVFTQNFDETLLREEVLPLDVVLGRIFALMHAYDAQQPIFRIVIQFWGILPGSPYLTARFSETQQAWKTKIQRLVERYQAHGSIDPTVAPESIAQVIIALIVGFICENALLGTIDVARFQASLRALLAPSLL